MLDIGLNFSNQIPKFLVLYVVKHEWRGQLIVQVQAGSVIQTDDQWIIFVLLKSQQVSSHFPEVIIPIVQSIASY